MASNIALLRREALADRVTGWPGAPALERVPTVDDALRILRRCQFTEMDIVSVLNAVSGRVCELAREYPITYATAREACEHLDNAADEIESAIIRRDEAADQEAEEARQWHERRAHEADIMRDWK